MALPTEPQGLEPYDHVMEKILEYTSVDQDQVERLMTLVGIHESGGDPNIIQKSNVYNANNAVIGSKEGPGRGLYQYELETLGGSGAGRVAMNRLYAVLGGDLVNGKKPANMPKWMNKYFSVDASGNDKAYGDVDFSELTEEQQKILFLADKLQDPKVKLSDIGVMSDAEWWAKYHHKGADSNVQKFSDDAAKYLKGEFRKLHNIE
jgi:hypothetical protein